jgi:predicted nucleic acid-binding protein
LRYWDSSALVPLLVSESRSNTLKGLLAGDPEVAVWWGSRIECASALGRRERSAGVDESSARANRRLNTLSDDWIEVPPSEQLRELAVGLVRIHDLRAGDALQLAAALVAAEEHPATLDLVTLDDRLALAARREGFRVLPT